VTDTITCPPQTPCTYDLDKEVRKEKDCKEDYETGEKKYYIKEAFGYTEITETIVCD
jgi:hypothetical protein